MHEQSDAERIARMATQIQQQATCLQGFARTLADHKEDCARREATLVERIVKLESQAVFMSVAVL